MFIKRLIMFIKRLIRKYYPRNLVRIIQMIMEEEDEFFIPINRNTIKLSQAISPAIKKKLNNIGIDTIVGVSAPWGGRALLFKKKIKEGK